MSTKKSKQVFRVMDLQQEIKSLRDGLNKTAGALATAMVELEDARKALSSEQLDNIRLRREMQNQEIELRRQLNAAHRATQVLIEKIPTPASWRFSL